MVSKLNICFLALFSCNIYANDFKVYGFIPWNSYTIEDKTYKLDNNLNLKRFGIEPIRVIYSKYFLTNDQPDLEKIKKISQSTNDDKTPISFDIEIGNRFKPQTNLPVILKTLSIYRQFGGKAPVGIYAVLPQNTYGGNRLNSLKVIMYKNLNQQYKDIADLVDFISPSLYNYDGNDLEAWKKSALFSMQESKKYAKGKPIIPYVTGTFAIDLRNPYPLRSDLTESDMQQRLSYLKSLGASAVIVWQSSSEKTVTGDPYSLNFNKGWGKALINIQ